jgi:hypothetical protein
MDRQTTVFTPPGPNGTINFMARVGYTWPLAGKALERKTNRNRELSSIPFHLKFIIAHPPFPANTKVKIFLNPFDPSASF